MNTTKEHIAKLFASKGVANSNIWLEGERLSEAGFTVGVEYSQAWFKDKLVLTTLSPIAWDGVIKTVRRKVVASGNNPAIRIEGNQVLNTFGTPSVKCVFSNNMIEITPYKSQSIREENAEMVLA